jgi:DNA modification methylase
VAGDGADVRLVVTPFVSDPDFTLYVGDALTVLAGLPAGSVDCCVTSPPYWGLRDYGNVGQLGLEASPQEYVAALVAVFREVRRVLAPAGTCWLNLGDSYASSPPGNKGSGLEKWASSGLHGAVTSERYAATLDASVSQKMNTVVGNLKPKDLVGIPWRVAFALQQDGWWLRSDIVWSKPNPMPESVTDRPTKSHEYVFLLTKSPRYFFDQEAVREPAEWARWGDQTNGKHQGSESAANWIPNKTKYDLLRGHGAPGRGFYERWDGKEQPSGRNVRSVWEIATQPYPEAHFAVFPEALPERCIKAGCPERVCGTCGKPSERIVERTAMVVRPTTKRAAWQADDDHARTQVGGTMLEPATSATVGCSDCGHNNWRPGLVLDPFMGSGTTALVARKLGRRSIGIELNEDYAKLAARRLQQLSLLAEVGI